jgi:Zn-dependent protease
LAQYHDVYNPYYGSGSKFTPRRRFGTSVTELIHLFVAVTVLTTAIVLWMNFATASPLQGLDLFTKIYVALGIAVTGFALHEIGHKITAQHFGHWSEFRFSIPGLALTLIVSALGFLLGAPGATWHTATSPKENGKISAAGPLVNIVIGVIAWPLSSQYQSNDFAIIADGVLLFNAILAAFNLIPLGALDGRKVLKWNPVVYFVLVGLVVGLFVAARPLEFLGI